MLQEETVPCRREYCISRGNTYCRSEHTVMGGRQCCRRKQCVEGGDSVADEKIILQEETVN